MWDSICGALPWISVFTIFTFLLHGAGFFRPLEYSAFDFLICLNPVAPNNTILVNIDDQDYDQIFQSKSPLECKNLEKLLACVALGKPKLIVVDIDTSDPSFQDFDKNVLRDTRVIWAENATPCDALLDLEKQTPFGEEKALVVSRSGVLGGRAGQESAIALMIADPDGVVRSYPLTVPVLTVGQNKPVESDTLPWAVAKTDPGVRQPNHEGRILFDMSFAPEKYRGYTAGEVEAMTATGKSGWADTVKNKIVIVGSTYSAARDSYPTPRGMVAGAKILGLAIESHLQNKTMREPSQVSFVIADFLCGIAFTIAACLFSQTELLWMVILFPVLGMLFSYITFSRLSTWLCFVPVMVGVYLHFIYEHLKDHKELLREIKHLKEHIAASDDPPKSDPLEKDTV